MSSTRTNWKTGWGSCVSPQCSSTHCGPSSGAPVLASVCQPVAGGGGYPTSAAIRSVPSGFRPVAICLGTFTNLPVTLMFELNAKSK